MNLAVTQLSEDEEQADEPPNGKAQYLKYQQLCNVLRNENNRSQAFYWLQCAAETGYSQAQYELGRELTMSDNSVDMAVCWLQKAAKQGVGEAFAELDELDSRGHPNAQIRIDKAKLYAEAAPALQLAADAGNSAAAVEFAVCCENGYGIAVDKAKAFQLYIYEAGHDNVRAMVKAGDCYVNGVGAKRDKQLAVQYYQKAVQHGSVQGMIRLARCMRESCVSCGCGMTAFELLKRAAEHGSVEARLEVGRYVTAGFGTRQDKQQVITWYQQLVEHKNVDAMCALAEFKTKNNNIKAAELFSKAAELGSAVGQRRLADCYFDGIGVVRDQKRAVELYQKATDQLDVLALRKLGLCYLNQTGVGKDISKAAELFKQAAAAGDAEAQSQLAKLLLKANELERNAADAVIELKNAEDNGNQDAAQQLAICCENATDVPQDGLKAAEMIQAQAKLDNTKAHMKLGFELLEAEKPNEKGAFEHFKQAADNRSADGQYQVGCCCENGVGTTCNFDMAAEYYREAAGQGHVEATVRLAQLYALKLASPASAREEFRMYDKDPSKAGVIVQLRLATCYETGTGIYKSEQKAKTIYHELAKQGSKGAADRLAAMYLNGDQDQKHNQKAIEAYWIAADLGNADAQYELAKCHFDGTVVSDQSVLDKLKVQLDTRLVKDYVLGKYEFDNDKEFVCLLQSAENQNDPNVLQAIGVCYQHGWGVKQNMSKAVEYYVKAADAGSFEAMERLRRCTDNEVDEQLKAAFQHFGQLADNGNANAQFAVGYCRRWSVGAEYNDKLAWQALFKAASGGCTNAMTLLGIFYESGFKVDVDKAKAFQLYKQAAELGSNEGQFRFAQCYNAGIGATQDKRQAVFWFEKAAMQGHCGASCALGIYYGEGVEKDEKMAFQYYRQAAIAGDMHAQCYVGSCYQNGDGVRQSYRMAEYWLGKAVGQGNSAAADALVYCQMTRQNMGENVQTTVCFSHNALFAVRQRQSSDKQQEIAFSLVKLAAANGCANAFVLLGDCYFSGIGARKSMCAAADSYEQAQQLFPEFLCNQWAINLAECYASGEVVGKNEIDAFSLIKRANATLRGEMTKICFQMQYDRSYSSGRFLRLGKQDR